MFYHGNRKKLEQASVRLSLKSSLVLCLLLHHFVSKTRLGEIRGYFILHFHVKIHNWGKSGHELKQEAEGRNWTETTEERCFLAGLLSWLAQLLFYHNPGLHRDGTTQSGLVPLVSINNEETAPEDMLTGQGGNFSTELSFLKHTDSVEWHHYLHR